MRNKKKTVVISCVNSIHASFVVINNIQWSWKDEKATTTTTTTNPTTTAKSVTQETQIQRIKLRFVFYLIEDGNAPVEHEYAYKPVSQGFITWTGFLNE